MPEEVQLFGLVIVDELFTRKPHTMEGADGLKFSYSAELVQIKIRVSC